MTKIGVYTFKGCGELTSVTIPESVTEIGDGAFEDCGKVTIHCKAGSYAETFAKEKGIAYVAK